MPRTKAEATRIWRGSLDPEAKAEFNRRKAKSMRDRRRTHTALFMFKAARRRAKASGIPFSITVEDIMIPEVCPILGLPLSVSECGKASSNSPSLDRIKPRLGYVAGNVMVISHRANTLKSDATPVELQKLAEFYHD